jgi:diacylglycerol kinase (ATP)
MSRVCIILNPAAKGERARRFLHQLRKVAKGAVFKLTQGPGDAEAQAERAVQQGYDVVVAAGGDGTINEVVNGLAGAPVSLGVLPIGTVNVFAMEMGIPMRAEDAWKVIKNKKTRSIDLAEANDHKFVQLAGIGLDAQVVEKTDRVAKKKLGPLSYLFTATQIAARKPPKLRIISAEMGTLNGSFVLVGNGRFYGGPFAIFTEAENDDGLLDVCVFKDVNYIALARYARGILFWGAHRRFTDVKYFKTKHVRVESEEVVPFEVDGELSGHVPVDIRISRRKLKVLVP